MKLKQPEPQTILKAQMAAKGLSQKRLHRLTGIPATTISQILNGHWIEPARLKKIEAAVEKYPGPKITVHA